jgi:hypothetical protein
VFAPQTAKILAPLSSLTVDQVVSVLGAGNVVFRDGEDRT